MRSQQLHLLTTSTKAVSRRPRILRRLKRLANKRYAHVARSLESYPLLSSAQDTHDQLAQVDVSTWADDRPLYFFCKRCLDLLLACLALTLLAPLMAILALLIKRDSPGGIIFAQERVGARRYSYQGKMQWQPCHFTCYKFRTMCADADPELHRRFVEAYIAGDEGGMAAVQPEKKGAQRYKLNGDPRITPLGKFLRKTSLDELPQLWNVLKGEMSLVGPRPAIPYEVAMYSDWHLQRLQTLPGMTGLWQVKGRGAMGFEEMVKLDIEYVQTQSLRQDLSILIGTIPAVLLNKGAA